VQAVRRYVEDVRNGAFPEAANVRHLPETEAAELALRIREYRQGKRKARRDSGKIVRHV
jgi:hypothetical protein